MRRPWRHDLVFAALFCISLFTSIRFFTIVYIRISSWVLQLQAAVSRAELWFASLGFTWSLAMLLWYPFELNPTFKSPKPLPVVWSAKWPRCNIHWIDDANIGDWIRKARIFDSLDFRWDPGPVHPTSQLGGTMDANQSFSRPGTRSEKNADCISSSRFLLRFCIYRLV